MASAEVSAASGPSYAPEDPTLPKPWTGLIDGSTGVLYYWNPETNVTQYEKPAPVGPPPSATPSLTPIPAAKSQFPANSTAAQQQPVNHSTTETAQQQPQMHQMPQQQPLQQPQMHQMPQQQPLQQPQMHQMPQQQQPSQMHQIPQQQLQQHPQMHQMTNPAMSQPNRQYPPMQMNQMPTQFPNPNLSAPYQQQNGQYQYPTPQHLGPPIGSQKTQPNGFPVESRQGAEPLGYAAPPMTSGAPASQFPVSGPQMARPGEYPVRPSGAYSEVQHSQMGNPRSQPYLGQNVGYNNDDHQGRGRTEGQMMLQKQPLNASVPHAGNHMQDMRTGSISRPVTSGHFGGTLGHEAANPKIHNNASFLNAAPRGAPQKMFGASIPNIQSTDAYCQHHEITVTGDNIPPPFTTFEATGFDSEILREMRYLLEKRAFVVGSAAIHSSTQQLLCL